MKYLLSLKSQNYQIHSNFRQIKDLISMKDNDLLDSPETKKSLSTEEDTQVTYSVIIKFLDFLQKIILK